MYISSYEFVFVVVKRLLCPFFLNLYTPI